MVTRSRLYIIDNRGYNNIIKVRTSLPVCWRSRAGLNPQKLIFP